MDRDVLVITGAGGIGQAIARRQGPGRNIVLADINQDALASAAAALEGLGLHVGTQRVDVTSRESVQALAEAAAELGKVTQSPTPQASRPSRRRRPRSSPWTCSAPPWCWKSSAASSPRAAPAS